MIPLAEPPVIKSPPAKIGGKILRYVLLGFGASLIITAVINITAAFQLIESTDEEALGITRNEIVGTYAVLLVVGAVVVFLGLTRKK